MKLRTFAVTSTSAIVAISCMVAGALTIATSYVDEQALAIASALERVRIIEEMEVDLLVHNRESLLYRLGGGKEHALARDAAAQQLRRWEEELPRRDEETARLIAAVERHVDAYFEAQQRTGASEEESLAAFDRGADSIDRALASMEQLLERQIAEARHARAQAALWNRASDIAGLVAIIVLLGMAALVPWLTSRHVYQPLLALRAAIGRYAEGEPDARAEPHGVDELREIAAAFNAMATALAQQRRRQLGVLASVAHDLRNPLAALKLSVDRVRPDRPLPPEDKLRDVLARVGNQVDRCNRMLSDLLDLARLEGGQLELRWERRDARDLCRDVVELYRSASASHEISLSAPEEPAPIRCDPLRIEQVMNNLVANAIKYSPAGGAVRVVVSSSGEEIRVAVSDEGVGIAKEEQGKLFQPYARAPSSRDVAAGVGLGLWAARRLVEAHGGRIELQSAPGAGSTFTVHLPRARPEAEG